MIYEYAVNSGNELRLFKGQSTNQIACSQIISLTNLYIKQTTALKNKLQTERVYGGSMFSGDSVIEKKFKTLGKGNR